MIRFALETSDDILTRINRRTTEVVSNIYDDIDAILPEWADSPEDFIPQKQQQQQETNYPICFSKNSILLNTIYPNYSYQTKTIYK